MAETLETGNRGAIDSLVGAASDGVRASGATHGLWGTLPSPCLDVERVGAGGRQ